MLVVAKESIVWCGKTLKRGDRLDPEPVGPKRLSLIKWRFVHEVDGDHPAVRAAAKSKPAAKRAAKKSTPRKSSSRSATKRSAGSANSKG